LVSFNNVNKNAKESIDQIEVKLQKFVVNRLQEEYGIEEDVWWYEGVPGTIRQNVSNKMEEDKNRRGGKEYYFGLIHYRKIITENWELFEKTFAYGTKGNKDKRTEWLEFINEIRKPVSHASSGKIISLEDYTQLVDYYNWMEAQIKIIEDGDDEVEEDAIPNDNSLL
jgi:hypothetical protein